MTKLELSELRADYLWNEGRAPQNGKLTVAPVDVDQLAVAARWSDDLKP